MHENIFTSYRKVYARKDSKSKQSLHSRFKYISRVRIGLLVGCFVSNGPFRPSVYNHLPDRGRKTREMEDERKNVQTAQTRTIRIAICPCSTIIQISKTPRHWKFTQNHRIPSSSTYPPTCQELPKLRPPTTAILNILKLHIFLTLCSIFIQVSPNLIAH